MQSDDSGVMSEQRADNQETLPEKGKKKKMKAEEEMRRSSGGAAEKKSENLDHHQRLHLGENNINFGF